MKSALVAIALSTGLLLAAPTRAQDTPPASSSSVAAADDLDIPEASDTEKAEAKFDAAQAEPARDPAAMDPAKPNPELKPVFDQFGGEPGLVSLMDLFMTKLVADPRTKPFFENADQAGVKRHLVEQFCAILGGGCTYTGRDMRTAHQGFNIERAQFNALVECLQKSMTEKGIPFRAQNQLLAKLALLHRDIEHR